MQHSDDPPRMNPAELGNSPASMIVDTWDAGELACGELLLELRARLGRLAPGDVLCLVTRDLGAILDIPAWCRVTGHILREASPPRYYLERRP